MKKIIIIYIILLTTSYSTFSQKVDKYSIVKTNSTDIRIPGEWKQLNTMDDSGQTYLENDKKVIIAIAKNPKKAYSFYKIKKSDFKNVQSFYRWDSDYRKELKHKTNKIKENSKLEYVIWKYNDGKLDNVFLFGSVNDNFLNLLVYTNEWDEDKKVRFLEKLYKLNK
jgi:hypothetical protein